MENKNPSQRIPNDPLIDELMSRINVDVDVKFCKENNFQFSDDGEIDSNTIELFTHEVNRAAFLFVNPDVTLPPAKE